MKFNDAGPRETEQLDSALPRQPGGREGTRKGALRFERILAGISISLLVAGVLGDIVGAMIGSVAWIYAGAVFSIVALVALAAVGWRTHARSGGVGSGTEVPDAAAARADAGNRSRRI